TGSSTAPTPASSCATCASGCRPGASPTTELPAAARDPDGRERRDREQRGAGELEVVERAVAEAGERHVVRDERAEAAVAGDRVEAGDAERHAPGAEERDERPRRLRAAPAGEPDEREGRSAD